MRRMFLGFLLVSTACGDNDLPYQIRNCDVGPEAVAAHPRDYQTLTMWVQDDPDLGAEAAQKGGDFWQGKCLRTEIVSEARSAAVKISASHDACVFDFMAGGFVLARAYAHGEITVYLECVRQSFLPDDDGRVSQTGLSLVLGHEIGHEAGMLWHVPPLCFEGTVSDDFEKQLIREGVCGRAIMNPVLHDDLRAVTEVDDAAYDLRFWRVSTFPHFTEGEGETGCVLIAPERP